MKNLKDAKVLKPSDKQTVNGGKGGTQISNQDGCLNNTPGQQCGQGACFNCP